MNKWWLFALVMGYLMIPFLVANRAEKKRTPFWSNNPYLYSLSLAVYCTAWTYYGSIGVAANQGINFLPIYLGPAIIIPAWIIINKKIIKISRVNKMSSIADFISLRYGNSRILGALVVSICLLAIVPYLGLQLKAISDTFHMVSQTSESTNVMDDMVTYVVLLIAIFSSFYGTRYVDASEKRLGIISAVAVESLLKLVFFIILGLFVCYGVFNGIEDIYQQASKLENFHSANTFGGLEGAANWTLTLMMSMMVIFLLPRQFHTAIIENRNEKHIKTSIWVFPLYLLLINFFVFPIAWGGNLLFAGENVNPEFYSLLIPQKLGNTFITLLVFLGGLSASVSMIIVSSIALSVMLTNNLLIPYGLFRFREHDEHYNSRRIVNLRKISILSLIILSFVFYKYFIVNYSLFSIGLISFVLIAQLGPAFFSSLFWKRARIQGAFWGMIWGVAITLICLVLPYFISSVNAVPLSQGKIAATPFLKYFSFFNIPYLDYVPQVFFWSLTVNILVFTSVSLLGSSNYKERNYAEMYYDIDRFIETEGDRFIWLGTAHISDVQNILERFLGKEKTKQALRIFNYKYNSGQEEKTNTRLLKFSQNLLSGRIGAASAKILLDGITKESKISLPEVLTILDESKENINLNKKLKEQSHQLSKLSTELKEMNELLVEKDRQKDDFLDAVAHELRTPITAIRSSSELIIEDPEMPLDIQRQFLDTIISETDRLTVLINDLLDLDKLSSTQNGLYKELNDIKEIFDNALRPLLPLIKSKNIQLNISSTSVERVAFDKKRMIQVFTNLMGNAIKFCPDRDGFINVKFTENDKDIVVTISNKGNQIPREDLDMIFEKFYQSKNKQLNKPTGSGLGLPICKSIIEAHQGTISAKNTDYGVTFKFNIPKN